MATGYHEAVRKRPLLNTVIRVAILAIVMVFLVRSRNTLFRSSKVPANTQPLIADDAASGERFTWLPKYPHAQPENIRTVRTHELVSYGFRFHAQQDAAHTLAFYETQLRAAGFTVLVKNETGELHAENPDRRRALDVTVAKIADGTEVGVAAVEK